MTIGTAFLVLGSGLYVQSNQRIELAEQEFTTIGMIEQEPTQLVEKSGFNNCIGTYTNPIYCYQELIFPEALDFEGAAYLVPPEKRHYFLTYNQDWYYDSQDNISGYHNVYTVEIVPMEDENQGETVQVEVQDVLLSDPTWYQRARAYDTGLRQGDIITFCQHFSEVFTPLKQGSSYFVNVVRTICPHHRKSEYVAYQAPYSSQCTELGETIASDAILSYPNLQWDAASGTHQMQSDLRPNFYQDSAPVEAHTDGFTASQWVTWANTQKMYSRSFPVLAANHLELLPSFHKKDAYLAAGREITEEEFQTGARVCMIPSSLAGGAGSVGTQISLGLYCTLYGYVPMRKNAGTQDYFVGQKFSLLNSEGSTYTTFWIDEYTVVGVYNVANQETLEFGKSELMPDLIIIPEESVESPPTNIAFFEPMSALTTSFQIPNGTIEEFDKKLHEAVAEADQLSITYDDNGYSDVIDSLNAAKTTAALLFAAGILAAFAIILLLLYFFIVKEKRRTAIERSLGMTKRQCRVSLLAGLVLLALAATILGSACGAAVLAHTDFLSQGDAADADYSTEYSLWDKESDIQVNLDADTRIEVYFVVPLGLLLVIFLLAPVAVNHNLRIEPIYLLTEK